MPNIIVESTPRFAAIIPFSDLFLAINREIVAKGHHAEISGMKSRLHITDTHLMGDEEVGEFIFATLLIKQERPKIQQQAMSNIIRDILLSAIEEKQPDFWWQLCVSIQTFEIGDYLKTDSRVYVAHAVA